MRTSATAVLLLSAFCVESFAQVSDDPQRLRRRNELPAKSPEGDVRPEGANGVWVVPAGTKIPIQLRQAVSTKNAQPGDPIYGQTTFPVIIDNVVMIPAGTFVRGVVDTSKRAGRVKGRAELQFHLTSLIYANGYTLDIAAAVDQVPGSADTRMKEPGKIEGDTAKDADFKTVTDAAVIGGSLGAMGGAASGSLRGLGIGGVSGIAAGTLVGILARGADVRFEIGSGVEISLNRAIGVEEEKVTRGGMLPASHAPAPVIAAPVVQK
jgi:type IV secretion system protein VirB10